MKILLTDTLTLKSNNDLSLSPLYELGDITEYENIDRKTLLEEVSDFDILLCNKTIIDSQVISAAKKLKYIGLFATGYNNIDLSAAAKHSITVTNAGSYSTNAVAQQVFAFILQHFSRVSEYNSFVKKGGWERSCVFAPLEFQTAELFGKTIGIVGYGSIGKEVEKIAKSFGMKVLLNTRTVKSGDNRQFLSLQELLRLSDIVSLHCPLTDKNADMMNTKTFSQMKDGAFFINTARGGLVDEDALYDALESGKLSGAAIDVLKKEPMPAGCRLKDAKNIIITPHTAWSSLETRSRLLGVATDNLKAFLSGNPKNVIE